VQNAGSVAGIGRAAILQGYRVVYREAHTLPEELAEATLAGTRKDYLTEFVAVRATKLANQGADRLAHGRRNEVELTGLGRARICRF
jgi:hypothetical protein